MSQDTGQSSNRQFSGFERPTPEVREAFAYSRDFAELMENFLAILPEPEAKLKVVSHFFLAAILSGNLDQQFTVNYAELPKQLNVGIHRMRKAVSQAVQSGYFRVADEIGVKGSPRSYAINWRDNSAAK